VYAALPANSRLARPLNISPTHHTQTMSTKPTPTAAEIDTNRTTLSTRDAPQTFDPFNTNETPRMFSDKWQDIEN
jgi:hypothetical protein